jgi:hypothetical protein
MTGRYLLRCAAFAALFCLANAAMLCYLRYTTKGEAFFLGYRLKHALLRSTPPPRVLLVGGSSTVFGTQGGEIERATGMSVVNAGLQADLGLRYLLDDVEPEIRTGDIVVVTPEYNLFYANVDGGNSLLPHLLVNPSGARSIHSIEQVMNLLAAIPFHLRGRINTCMKSVLMPPGSDVSYRYRLYYRSPFDEYGGTSSRDSAKVRAVLKDYLLINLPVDAAALELFCDFVETIRRRAVVLVCYPSIPADLYTVNEDRMTDLHRMLSARLGSSIPRPPEAWILPEDLFLDTAYHLNVRGRDRRTAMLLEEIARIRQREGVR